MSVWHTKKQQQEERSWIKGFGFVWIILKIHAGSSRTIAAPTWSVIALIVRWPKQLGTQSHHIDTLVSLMHIVQKITQTLRNRRAISCLQNADCLAGVGRSFRAAAFNARVLCQVLLGDILQYGALVKNSEFQWTGTMRAESMVLWWSCLIVGLCRVIVVWRIIDSDE